MPVRIIETDAPLADEAVLAVRDALRGGAVTAADEKGRIDVEAVVDRILHDVRARGDEALTDWERTLDKADLTPATLRVGADEIRAAHAGAEPAFLELIRRVADNIREYQEAIRWQDPPALKRGGRELGVRYTPVDAAAVYVPGLRALYPSTVLMTVVPARVAGVGRIVMASPPTHDSDVHPLVLAIACELGIDEVYRLGGAPAVAALAFGTESVRAVDKIVGPGNAFVAEAKRRVSGRVGIDSIAGPSEVLLVADGTADADWVAADMLAQAEHDPGSAVLVTTSRELAEGVVEAVERQLPRLQRAEALRAALAGYSAIVVVPTIDAACDVANDFATEHLQIVTADDEAVLAKIRHAGAIFLGPHTPVPLGDYCAGPSHVLPTGGTARFFGPLSCNDFLKASSIVRYDVGSLREDADGVIDFATREGLTAHAAAIHVRTDKSGS